MNSINKTARMAGFLYLMYMVTTIAADVFGRSKLIVFGDAAATARNIMASEWQFRIGIMGDLVSAVFFLLAAWALYALLKPVNKDLALSFVLLNLGGVAVYSINLLNQFAAVLLLSGADYLKVFQADQLQALAMFFLNLHHNGYWIAQIFFGAWLFPLGIFGFQVRLPSQNFGHRDDDPLCWLVDDFSPVLPFPGLRRNNLCNLSARIYFRIWAYFVAFDQGCKCRRMEKTCA